MRQFLDDFRQFLANTLAAGFFCGALLFCCVLGYQLAESIAGRY